MVDMMAVWTKARSTDLQLTVTVTLAELRHNTSCKTQFYFILSSEINAYQKQIKVISITCELI